MNLDIAELKILTTVAINAAIKAGDFIQSSKKVDIGIAYKNTGSSLASKLVTKIDLKSQDIILEGILPTCEDYHLGLLTEECIDDGSRFIKDYFWCIDPLDGTLPFINSYEGYAISIALVSTEGVPFIGVVYDPVAKNLYHAIKGIAAFYNHKPWKIASGDNVCKNFEIVASGGAVMNACWVLEKSNACFYKLPKEEEGGGCLWDYAATACIFNEVGGWVSDIYGQPLDFNNKDSIFMNHNGVVYATSRELARQFMKPSS
ncbi:MAG: inositol monophosphatase family protein [bacterium]|nr:inositol monophosphatase family protein [bacterium]